MNKLCISVAAAALLGAASSVTAQLSPESSRKAERAPVATTGTMHDHVERAEKVLHQLLRKRYAGSNNPADASKNMIAVQRTQLERLQVELDAVQRQTNRASTQSTSELASHVATAKSIATSLASESSSQAANANDSSIVTVDRSQLKQLEEQIDAIEHAAKEHDDKH
jgi:flagellar biosynthesis chaperone FliJ